jgi:hypothetical protein
LEEEEECEDGCMVGSKLKKWNNKQQLNVSEEKEVKKSLDV